MSNGSDDSVRPAPPALRCPHVHNEAEDTDTSINPDPSCDGRCIFVVGHPHPGDGTTAIAAQVGATKYLIEESLAYQGIWQYAGGCCKCEKCHKWVKDWGVPETATGGQ
jgi:hypothetical protein